MDVRKIFNQFASDYDRTRRGLIPGFDEFYGSVLRLLPFSHADAFQVLDLGAGTGLLSALIGAQYPHAQVTLVDFAPRMIDRAVQRLAGEGNRITFLVQDYLQEPLPGPVQLGAQQTFGCGFFVPVESLKEAPDGTAVFH